MKSKCEVCGEKRNLFTANKSGKEVKACSNCITTIMMTGWSK
jgi:ribosome-binding protein aMBF1 (putative translation factor)